MFAPHAIYSPCTLDDSGRPQLIVGENEEVTPDHILRMVDDGLDSDIAALIEYREKLRRDVVYLRVSEREFQHLVRRISNIWPYMNLALMDQLHMNWVYKYGH